MESPRITPRIITKFDGPYAFLSNFYHAFVSLDGVDYPTVEHAYQAAKTRNTLTRAAIRSCATPAEAKKFGRAISLRSDWTQVKIKIMKQLLRQKFENPKLRLLLLATGDATLVEGNTWGDRFWGQVNGKGHNHLGNLLMVIRNELRTKEGDLDE